MTRLKDVFRPFGWFGNDAGNAAGEMLFHDDHRKPDDDNLYVITPNPATDRPVPSPEELVNDIFGRIARSLSPGEAEREDKEYVVIVDSITALLKGCVTPADERRQTHELLYRLRVLFGRAATKTAAGGRTDGETGRKEGRLILTILLAEQDQPSDTSPKPASVEDYLADIVFRLSNKPQPLGRRFRELEIVKSQGVHMIPGEHSWAIVTNNNCDHYMRHPVLKKEVESDTFRDGDGEAWGTIVIFARARMLHKSLGPRSTASKDEAGREPMLIHSGTDGLDEMLTSRPEYWLPQQPLAAGKGGLVQGKTTLVAGPIGAGKTTLCLQFLLNQHELLENLHRPAPERPRYQPESLFISLNADALRTVRNVYDHLAYEIRDSDYRLTKLPKSKYRDIFTTDPWARHLAVLDFSQSLFDFNHLIAHLNWAIERFQPKRIAFDGLSEWLTTFNKSDATKMLEAIGVLIANHRVYDPRHLAKPAPTVFMTFDMNTREDPLAPQATGINADYIIALKQVNLQDEIRKVIYILKSADAGHDPTVREMSIQKERTVVRSALDNFNGLLSGRPQPAEVLLQLFQENNAEETFNRWLNWRLTQLSSLRFKSLDFSRSEIGPMFEDFGSRTRFPAADLKILSVDEWWLASQPPSSERRAMTGQGTKPSLKTGAKITSVPEQGSAGGFPPPAQSGQPEAEGGDAPAPELGKAAPDPEPPRTVAAPEHSTLLNLAGMWAFDEEEKAPLASSWRDFWLFEVDKCAQEGEADRGDADAVRYAVPASIDFGLFCVNRRMLEQHENPLAEEVRKFQQAAKGTEEYFGKLAAKHQGATEGEEQSGNGTRKTSRARWKSTRDFEERVQKNTTRQLQKFLLDVLPRYWAKPKKNGEVMWFDGTKQDIRFKDGKVVEIGRAREPGEQVSPDEPTEAPPTLVSLLIFLREDRPERTETESDPAAFLDYEKNRWGFSFDMGTRETCVCVFCELAWSFGASA
ncbi:MAG TPA: ATPase domain-containing protein, partial [Chthoniobacteraceae bacterium]|nr:ATPase domain-containing protein [Chthoniobacteraceae bacterium]